MAVVDLLAALPFYLPLFGLDLRGIRSVRLFRLFRVAKLGLPLGRLPGDIHIEREGSSFHFPIVTCNVISALLSIILTIIIRLLRR